MFCKNCGKEVSEGANFCSACGTVIDNETVTEQSGNDLLIAKKKSTSKIRVAIVSLFLLFLAGIVSGSIIKGDGEKKAIAKSEITSVENNENVVEEEPTIELVEKTELQKEEVIEEKESIIEENEAIIEEKIIFDSSSIRIIEEPESDTVAEPNAKLGTDEKVKHIENAEKVTEKITYDTVIEYTDEVILYDFKKSGNVGSTPIRNVNINYEGYCGTRMSIDGNTLTYSFYKHSSQIEPNARIRIFKLSDKNTVYSDVNVTKDTNYTFDITDLENGLYYLYTVVPTAKDDVSTYHYFYVNGNDSYMCSIHYGSKDTIVNGRGNFVKAMKNIDPNDCLDLDEITYPTSGSNGRVTHVDLWVEKGKELIKDDWTDEAKVFAFVNYIASNVAYDSYKVDKLKYSRARVASTDTYDGYTDDNNFAYYNGVGVCWDYTNILAIMCRSNGIPCTSYDEYMHTYNAIYLNGHWMPIDITLFNDYVCDSPDTSEVGKQSETKRKYTNGYGTYKGVYEPLSIGKQIWTYENATNPDNNVPWLRD